MSYTQSFEVNFLKRMTIDSLIKKCRKYVEQYLSRNAAARLDKAYKELKFDEVRRILEKTLKRIKIKIKITEYQKAEKAVLDEFPDAERLFASSDNMKRSRNENMEIDSGVAVVVIGVAILVIVIAGAFIHLKLTNKTVGEVLSIGKDTGTKTFYCYTEKDRDLMTFIHELSVIYDNIDQYLNN